MLKKPIAIQTFTVRDEIEKDYRGAMERIAKIGYEGVEIGGNTGGMTPAELKTFLDGIGLKAMSLHSPHQTLTTNLDSTIEFAKTLGMKFVVCPIFGGKSAGDYYTMAKTLSKVGAKLKEQGIQLCYHNHAHEFEKYDGNRAIDILLANSDHDNLKWQLDTYWVKVGGEKPEDYIRKYSGRVPLLHIKDMTASPDPTFAEVGEGILNWPEIFAAADEALTEWYVVEQDVCQRPQMESAKISFENLKKMGVVRD